MKNKQYYRETQAAWDAFYEYCAHKACEECAFDKVNKAVYGCFGRWLNEEVDIVLLPCPHCGGKAGLYIDASGVWVECNECGSETSHGDNAPLAVEIWNMRAQAPALKKEGGPKPVSKGGAR